MLRAHAASPDVTRAATLLLRSGHGGHQPWPNLCSGHVDPRS
ncbi:uncharacterized protein J3R85_012251 [Psidium guajava]|nr:uncharacterized protein J3R85_012251 [Psidium guajava]